MKYRELRKRLRKLGILEETARGKGAHRVFYRESDSRSYAMPYNGDNWDVYRCYIKAVEEQFDVDLS